MVEIPSIGRGVGGLVEEGVRGVVEAVFLDPGAIGILRKSAKGTRTWFMSRRRSSFSLSWLFLSSDRTFSSSLV